MSGIKENGGSVAGVAARKALFGGEIGILVKLRLARECVFQERVKAGIRAPKEGPGIGPGAKARMTMRISRGAEAPRSLREVS